MTRKMGMALLAIGAALLMAGTVCRAAAGDERFFGGGFDGYTKTSRADLRIIDGIPPGTVFSIR